MLNAMEVSICGGRPHHNTLKVWTQFNKNKNEYFFKKTSHNYD